VCARVPRWRASNSLAGEAASAEKPRPPTPSTKTQAYGGGGEGMTAAPSIVHLISPYLDTHFLFPLLNWSASLNPPVFNPDDLKRAKRHLLESTNMVDFALQESPGDERLLQRRQEVLDTLLALKKEAAPLTAVLETEQAGMKERQEWTRDKVLAKAGQADLDVLYLYGKCLYECGKYEEACKLFTAYRELEPQGTHSFDALWGKLASEILMLQWNPAAVSLALADLNELQALIDKRDEDPLNPSNPLEMLQLRSWMMNWSLFVFFHASDGRDRLVEFFIQRNKHRNLIETLCPWLLRYAAAAALSNKGRRPNALRTLAQIIEQERYEYSDAITELILVLQHDFDFDAALDTLAKCEVEVKQDYFLAGLHKDFVDNARALIFHTQACLHSSLSIPLIREKLGVPQDDAAVSELVRSAKLPAKIDLERNAIVMSTPQSVLWQQVEDRTKDLTMRTFNLVHGLSAMQKDGLL